MTDGEDSPDPSPLPPKPPVLDRYIHSDIWDRLVQSNDDITGIIAYGLYQQRKREWIVYRKATDSCMPSEPAVKDYSASYTAKGISSLREDAEGILFRFGSEYADSQLPEMSNNAFNQRTLEELTKLKGDINSLRVYVNNRTGYTHHLKTHILGFISIAGVIAFVTWGSSYDSPRELVNSVIKFFSGWFGSRPSP